MFVLVTNRSGCGSAVCILFEEILSNVHGAVNNRANFDGIRLFCVEDEMGLKSGSADTL